MNRLLGTRAWRPASAGNNVVAVGPGLRTTLGALGDGPAGEARIEYESVGGRRMTFVTRTSDLRGQEVPSLVEEVLALGESLDGVNLGALGARAAVVNVPERVLTAALPLPLPHRSKERLVWRALTDGLAIRPGTSATLTVTDENGAVVGEASLALAQ